MCEVTQKSFEITQLSSHDSAPVHHRHSAADAERTAATGGYCDLEALPRLTGLQQLCSAAPVRWL